MLGLTAFLRDLTNTRSMDVSIVDGNGDQVTNFGSSVTFPAPPANATLTSVTASSVSTTLLTSNPNRRKFIAYNESGKTIKIAFAPTATQTAYTIQVPSQGVYESDLNSYTGDVSVITVSGTGSVRVTEITV